MSVFPKMLLITVKKLIFYSCHIFTFLVCCSEYAISAQIYSIKGERVFLREDPDSKSKSYWEFGNGFPVEVLKKKGDWLFIRDFEKDTGWVHKTKLSKIARVVVKANKNEEQAINIRTDPTLDSTVVGKAFYGVVFFPLQRKNGWVQVQHETGLTGWVKSEFLWGL